VQKRACFDRFSSAIIIITGFGPYVASIIKIVQRNTLMAPAKRSAIIVPAFRCKLFGSKVIGINAYVDGI